MTKKIFNRIRDVLLSPTEFWKSVKEENLLPLKLLAGYFIPFVAIASLAVFIGTWFSSAHFYVGFALLKSLRELILFILFVYISIIILNSLAPLFEGKKNLPVVHGLVIYSLTPFLIVSIVTGFFPGLYIINVLGLYGVWILRIGIKELDFIPERKQAGFIAVSVLLCLFVLGFLSVILWKIFTFFY